MLQKNSIEYFVIEYRRRAGRDATLPAEGLAVWHVDELGSNTSPESAEAGHRHYECVLAQADGRTGHPPGSGGDDGDLFGPCSEPLFVAERKPSSLWWDGSASGLQISRIRPVAGGLEFVVG